MEGNRIQPSASLLTAVLVAGAATMTGMAERNGDRLQLYDVNQGFGRVDLSGSLPLKDVTPEGFRLQVCGCATRCRGACWGSLGGLLILACSDGPAPSSGPVKGG